jgi:phosphate transport system permease protein
MKSLVSLVLAAVFLTVGAAHSQDQAQAASALSPTLQRVIFGLVTLAGLALVYVTGRNRAITMRSTVAQMHSLPSFHGAVTMQYAVLGAVLGLAGFTVLDRPMGMMGAALAAAGLGLAGAGFGLTTLKPDFRARTFTERSVLAVLILCSLVAVLTTVGIVGSLVVETFHFFQLYPAADFFFSTTWSPKFGGGSSLGLWPLVWGTLYVSAIALVVAVPIGLMSAIYLAEYATARMRSFVKPAIEILAGIPTIVYGLFALITVGPLLRDYFSQPLGFGNSSSSVMTAGLVMGIMIIPFVSSLSDDIINAVPQSLRDGSLGIGATPSETVRYVVIPAALPGIVGAILLATSRAIGETMIVVLGAGAAAKLSLNPFEAMTTVTVKIVSQLTGDTEFASPETLVAFALGLTLFTITLALNVVALVIVRKYREQYE